MHLSALDGWIDAQPTEDRPLLRAATGADQGHEAPGGPAKVGVAVSGGGDSMALLHLLADAAPHCGFQVEAATVNHQLRPGAAGEAAFVAQVCAVRGLPHRTLVWDSHPATGNLMQAASAARLSLLAGWARSRGLARVALAHTSDDQAETFLMALGRGTGLDGLCGLRSSWHVSGMGFARPLLRISRADLRGYLRRHGRAWCEDPTNDDDRYARSRARKALLALAPLGITEARLNDTMRHLAQVRAVLDRSLAEFVEAAVTEAAGALHLRRADYLELPVELRRRLLAQIIRWMSGARHAPRADQLFSLSMTLCDAHSATLGGCQFINDGSVLTVLREAKAVQPRVPATEVWDHRWKVEGPFEPGQEIGALGEAGLLSCPGWREAGVARAQLLVSPAVWQGERLTAAPCAGFGQAIATTCPTFHRFILSH